MWGLQILRSENIFTIRWWWWSLIRLCCQQQIERLMKRNFQAASLGLHAIYLLIIKAPQEKVIPRRSRRRRSTFPDWPKKYRLRYGKNCCLAWCRKVLSEEKTSERYLLIMGILKEKESSSYISHKNKTKKSIYKCLSVFRVYELSPGMEAEPFRMLSQLITEE